MFKKIRRFIKDPKCFVSEFLFGKCPDLMPDKLYLSVYWKQMTGYKLDWKAPRTFNEKLQWLKLYDRNPLYTKLVDKCEVKQWVTDRIGKQFVIPTLAVYNNVDEIDISKLPEKFVLKCTHDSGSVIVCKDKSTFDLWKAKVVLQKGLEVDFYKIAREWPYKDVPRRIIAEVYIESDKGDLYDYKFFCFNGLVKCFRINFDKETNPHANFYDKNGKLLPFGETVWERDPDKVLPLPSNLDEMISLAEEISKDMPFCRVDFYDDGGRILFGECTFFPDGGFGRLTDVDWENKLGSYIDLNMSYSKKRQKQCLWKKMCM